MVTCTVRFMMASQLNCAIQVQYGSSKLPEEFFTGEVDAFWRNETSFEESRRHYMEEREKLRKAEKRLRRALSTKVSAQGPGVDSRSHDHGARDEHVEQGPIAVGRS